MRITAIAAVQLIEMSVQNSTALVRFEPAQKSVTKDQRSLK